jgi:hypothetical protein
LEANPAAELVTPVIGNPEKLVESGDKEMINKKVNRGWKKVFSFRTSPSFARFV